GTDLATADHDDVHDAAILCPPAGYVPRTVPGTLPVRAPGRRGTSAAAYLARFSRRSAAVTRSLGRDRSSRTPTRTVYPARSHGVRNPYRTHGVSSSLRSNPTASVPATPRGNSAVTVPYGSTAAVMPSLPARSSQRRVSMALSRPMSKCCLAPAPTANQASLVLRTNTLA